MQGECQVAVRPAGGQHALLPGNTRNTPTMPTTAVTFDTTSPSLAARSTTGTSKSSSIFGSRRLWGFKDNFLSGISSRLEALQSSFTETTTNSSNNNDCGSAQDQPPPPPPSSSSASPANSLNGSPSTGKQRRKPTKVRSIYGQPEIMLGNPLQRSKDTSMDSLDTLDSGQSMGGSSCVSVNELRCLELHDALKPYRPSGDSLGIGSGQETSLESSEAEEETDHLNQHYTNCYETHHRPREPSRGGSVKSWTSSLICDGQPDEDDDEMVRKFMQDFVNKIFQDSSAITLAEKAQFGAQARTSKGRFYFSRYINEKRVYQKQVNESTFYSLVQYFAIILFECSEAEDFSPAKTIMNMCFTFYHEPATSRRNSGPLSLANGANGCCGEGGGGEQLHRQYLYQYLKEQPIWRSHRFWSAAFFDSVHCEKAKSPIHERIAMKGISQVEREEEAQLQENTVFGQLGAFTYYLKEFGLSEKFCLEFLKKQATIGNLSKDQILTLRQNVATLYNQ